MGHGAFSIIRRPGYEPKTAEKADPGDVDDDSTPPRQCRRSPQSGWQRSVVESWRVTLPAPKTLALILALVLAGAGCQQPAPVVDTWLVVDRDADPQHLGGHPGALFTVNPQSGKVEVFCTSAKWKDPVDVLLDRDGSFLVLDYHDGGTGGIFRVSADGKQVNALDLPKGLVDPTHFQLASDGWLWIVDKNADPQDLGKANAPTGTLWRLSPDHTRLEILATGPPLQAPACLAFVDGIPYLLDADAFRTKPISHEGAIFRVHPQQPGKPGRLETAVRLKGLLSPISMQPFGDGSFLVVDVNADPQRPSRHWGAVYLVNLSNASTTLFCHDPALRDPASATLVGDELLLVDASADPKGYGKDGTGQGYGGFGRGAVFRIDLAQRRAHLACASKQFVNPVRVEVLQR